MEFILIITLWYSGDHGRDITMRFENAQDCGRVESLINFKEKVSVMHPCKAVK